MHCCPHCNKELQEDSLFCPACGSPVTKNQARKKPVKNSAIMLIIAVVAVIAVLAVLAVLLFPKNNVSFSDDPAAISAASQSVVMLSCYDQNGELFTTGSGFAFFEDGVIVTNYHVIDEEAYRIEVSTEAGNEFDVSWLLAYDKDKDIAILGTEEATGLTLLQPGDSQSLQKGEKVVAIGSPLGLMNSVSTGVFSAYVQEVGINILQFTAAISSGSSGGALFNESGEVLGITFASYEDGQNLNLAVPIEDVSTLWANRSAESKQSIKDFYDTQIHTYTVDYVIENYDRLEGRIFYVEGWVLSHNIIESSSPNAWCTLYSTTSVFPSFEDSQTACTDYQIPNYQNLSVCLRTTKPERVYLFENLKTGNHILAKVSKMHDYDDGITLFVTDIQIIN